MIVHFRNYTKAFDFKEFNELLIDLFLGGQTWIAVSDCSYIPKSGKKSYGLDKYWNGCLQKALKGLEVSALALVSVNSGLALNLSLSQTPAGLKDDANRLVFYLQQLVSCSAYLLKKTKYWVVDGFYAKEKAWDQVAQLGLFMITARRPPSYAKMLICTIIYEGEQNQRGRKRNNGGKVDWKATQVFSRFDEHGLTHEGWRIYAKVVWSLMNIRRQTKGFFYWPVRIWNSQLLP